MNRSGGPSDPLAVLRRVVAAGGWVAIDTETTDLGPEAEIVELAIVTSDGVAFQAALARGLAAKEK